ncbi:MAG: DNA polymerase III subunit delta [Dehalococcoidia bacterium]
MKNTSVLLHGANEFLISKKILEIRNYIEPVDLMDVNFVQIDAKSSSLDEIINVCSTIPFMTNYRVVLVNFLSDLIKSDKSYDWENLSVQIDNFPESTFVIFRENELKKTDSIFKFLSDSVIKTNFENFKYRELLEWAKSRFDDLGVFIDSKALSLLIESVGTDLRLLDSEIQKLSMYKPSEMITDKDVGDLVAYVKEQSIFKLVDSVIDGNVNHSLKLIRSLIDSGQSFTFIKRMIERQIRLVLMVKSLKSQGFNSAQIGPKVSLFGYPLQKTLELEARLTEFRLIDMYQMILDSEIRERKGEMSEELSFEMLIYELAV